MEKRPFYVAVGGGEIAEDETVFDYEFEILATEEEIDRLQELFDDTAETEQGTALRGATPFVQYHNDSENDAYDQNLRDIYAMLHKLGTPETKAHIESMGILNKLPDTEYKERYPLG